MLNICKFGLIQDTVFFFVNENNNAVRINTIYNVFGTQVTATMDVSHEQWEKAVEDFIFSDYFHRREK